MVERAETHTIDRPARLDARSWLAERWFRLGVGAVSAGAAAFLVHQLMAWPPHEDETLALFVGRDSPFGMLDQVMRDRGGAPLHFAIAWLVAHLGFGLGALRLVSATFAVASLPLVAVLGRRLAGPREGLVASLLVATSWALLFHGVYARMYALFLFLTLASLLALLRAHETDQRSRWVAWGAATLLLIAAHPYGALVLAGEVVFLLAARRDRRRGAALATGCVVVLALPFWLSDLVLADRFDVGVGSGGTKLAGPWSIARYLWRTAGDFSAGWRPVLAAVLVVALVGLLSAGRRELRVLTLSMLGVPVAAFLLARLGGATSPESRHLLFVLPLFAIATATGILRITRRLPAAATLVVAGLLVAQVSWAWHRTPPLFEWEPDRRQATRDEAERYLVATALPDDVLFGYEPLYLGAWERNGRFPDLVLPRADAVLALRTLETAAAAGPLGHGIWVLDASERNNRRPRLEIERRDPGPGGLFETHAFGPFLVVRTRERVAGSERYLFAAARVMLLGRSLGIGDADVNLVTIERAERMRRGYPASSWLRSSHSR